MIFFGIIVEEGDSVAKDSFNNIRLSSENKHLLDIFDEPSYIELGNIDYQVLSRLLNYQSVTLRQLAYFPITNIGVGYIPTKNNEINQTLPFIYFDNIVRKSVNYQLFITYGILTHRDEANQELFSPIILLPVNMYIVDDDIHFQLLSRPIVNRTLNDYLMTNHHFNPSNYRFDDLSSLDKYLSVFNNIPFSHVSIENYLTYANTKTLKLTINHDMFSYQRLSSLIPYSRNTFIGLDNLNPDQYQSLLNAQRGSSFSIIGRLGTGKTTTLVNIALNAILEGKKVLYISNIQETLKQVMKYYQDHNLERYVFNLNLPYDELPRGMYNYSRHDNIDTTQIKEELVNDYQLIKEYESKLYGRICDYRYFEIVEQLVELAFKTINPLEVDDLTTIYQHEFDEIIKNVEQLQKHINHLRELNVQSINTSRFFEIPISLDKDLINKSAIIQNLKNLYDLFQSILVQKKLLEKTYHFKRITNYGRLGVIRSYLLDLNHHYVPTSWLNDGNKYFLEAHEKYPKLVEELSLYNESCNYLELHYQNLIHFNINSEIETILGDYFTIEDFEKIDRINDHRSLLTRIINRGAIERETLIKSRSRLFRYMDYHFDDHISITKEIIRLTDFLSASKYQLVWFDYFDNNQLEKLKGKLTESIGVLEHYYSLLNNLKQYFPKLDVDKVSELIALLKDNTLMSSLNKNYKIHLKNLKKKHNLENFNKIIEQLEELQTLIEPANIHGARYERLTGFSYLGNDDVISEIMEFNKYIKSIKDPDIRKHIIHYLKQRKRASESLENYDSQYVAFNLFTKSANNIFKIHQLLREYLPISEHDNLREILNDIVNAFTYLNKVFESNDLVKAKHREELEYVKFSQYQDLQKIINQKHQQEEYLNTHQEYQTLYGTLYQGVNTIPSQIAKLLSFSNDYVAMFESYSDAVKSLSNTSIQAIYQIMNKVEEISNQLTVAITSYNNVFKRTSVISYYNTSFKDVINYLETLINSDTELAIYLGCITNLQVLNKYRLSKLVGFIVTNKDSTTIPDDLKYYYYNSLNNVYLKSNELVLQSEEIKNVLEDFQSKCQELLKLSQEQIGYRLDKMTSNRLSIRATNYNQFIERSKPIKRLFLTNTTTLNNFLDVSKFDVVLIDDAQVKSAAEYAIALKAPQVIIAGLSQLRTLFSSDIISRMRVTNVTEYTYRYYPTPKHLLNNMDSCAGIFKTTLQENSGFSVSTKDIIKEVSKLLFENNNYRINIYASDLLLQRSIYQDLVNELLDLGLEVKKVSEIITKQINISDLANQYAVDADYNVLYLDEYLSSNYDRIAVNMFDLLLQVKKELIIYDPNNHLEVEDDSILVSKLKIFVLSNETFSKEYNSHVLKELALQFRKHKINVYSHHDKLSLILEHRKRLYGVLIIWTPQILSTQTIEDYYKYSQLYSSSGIKVFSILYYDLTHSLQEQVQNICEEIKNGETK